MAGSIKTLDKSVFATGARKEIDEVEAVLGQVDPKWVTMFTPEPSVEGFHGSKTLWETVKGNETYWVALEAFLDI